MRLLRQLWFLITRRRQEDDLAEELEFHRQMKAEQLRANGVSDRDLPADTQRALGNDLLARERSRDVWVAPWLQDVTQDLRFGLRMIVKERRFAVTAMVTLALGIAVSNAAFSFVNAAMFRDLPHASPDRLITIRYARPARIHGGVSRIPSSASGSGTPRCLNRSSAELSQSVNVSDDERTAERLSGTYSRSRRSGCSAWRRSSAAISLRPTIVKARPRSPSSATASGSIATAPTPPSSDGLAHQRPAVDRHRRDAGGFAYPYVADLWLPMAMAPGLRNRRGRRPHMERWAA